MASNSLNDDLDKAWQDCFEFQGKSHHFAPDTNAPNPGLTINGVGLIGLPLAERDAKAIISKYKLPASSASGPSKSAVVVNPSSFSLSKAQWQPFIEGLLMRTVETLGVKVSPNPGHKPRLELLKVTLHSPGTSTPQTLDTPKNPAAFATLTIVLPSQCSGGEVLINRGKDHPPTVYDTSKNSRSTYVLAWYNSIATAVQPVSAGYRLALTYGIIHTCSETPKPAIPNGKTIDHAFRPVLQRWKDGTYATPQKPKLPLIACVLNEYPNGVRKGIAGLTSPRNASIAKVLLPIAKSLGFSVCLARLNKKVVGLPDRDHFAYHFIPQHRAPFRNHRYNAPRYTGPGWRGIDDDYEFMAEMAEMRADYLEGDYETPDMGEIESEEYRLDEVTRIDGEKMSMKLSAFDIEEDNVIPSSAFQDADHDDDDDEEFDRDSGEITLEYQRSALVIYRTEDESDLFLATQGPFRLLKGLNTKGTPSPKATEIVNAALRQLEAHQLSTSQAFLVDFPSLLPRPREETAAAPQILTIALAWKQAHVWSRALPFCRQIPLQDLATSITSGIQVFTLEPIKDGLASLIKSIKDLHRRFKIIEVISATDVQALPPHCTWVSQVVQEALTSCPKPTLDDVSTILALAQSKGPNHIVPFIETVEEKGTYVALMALAKGLHKQRQLPTSSDEVKITLDPLIKHCVSIAIPQWEENLYVRCDYDGPIVINDKSTRICDILTFCFAIGDLQPFVDLLNGLFHFQPNVNVSNRIKEVHGPLISHLKPTLAKLGKPVDLEPFASFYRSTISLYLSHSLSAKPTLPALSSIVIGCGCTDCTSLKTFLLGTKDTMVLKATQHRRTHVESQIRKNPAQLGNFITTETHKHGSPHSLIVRKRSTVLEVGGRTGALQAAQTFVNFVCADEDLLRKLMGERYNDLLGALKGTKPFVLGDLVITLDSQGTGTGVYPVGTKRKREKDL